MIESVLEIRKKIKENLAKKKKLVPASSRHFSGYLFAYSSCARANFGHENGVTFPST